MTAQLEAMTEGSTFQTYPPSGMTADGLTHATEERQVREHFNAEHGAHLPEDICLCIGNPPTRWEVVPWNGEALEVLPDIEKELIAEVRPLIPSHFPIKHVFQAKDRTGNAEGAAGAESL